MRSRWHYFCAGILMAAPVAYGIWQNVMFTWFAPSTIKVGILHPMTGPLGAIERESLNTELLAIADLNQSGGVLGRVLEPVVMDTRSTPHLAPAMAEELVTDHHVDLLLGLWFSAARKRVKEVAAAHHVPYLFTASYEGCEQGPCMFYTGTVPNQQLLPALAWAAQSVGRSVFMVGHSDIYGEVMHHITQLYAPLYGLSVVGDVRLGYDAGKFDELLEKIRDAKPRFILSTLSGDASCSFLQQLHDQAVKIPVVATHFSSAEIDTLKPEVLAGNYVASSYVSSINSGVNQQFVTRMKKQFGQQYKIASQQESAYAGLEFWACIVQRAGSTKLDALRNELKLRCSMQAPGGTIFFDRDTQHTHQVARLGYLEKDGTISVTWSSKKPIKPQPYPQLKSQQYWDDFEQTTFKAWGNNWAKQKEGASA